MERIQKIMKRQGGGQEKERETEERNFVVTVEDYQGLFDFLRPLKGNIRFAPQEFRLGYTPLTGVLQEAELFVMTSGQEVCFGARFLGTGERFSPILYSIEHLSKRLSRFGLFGLGVTVWESPHAENIIRRTASIKSGFETRFVVHDEVENSAFSLGINSNRSFSEWRKVGSFNQFKKEVDAFILVVQALVEAVYKEANQPVPRAELILRKEPIDERVLLVSTGERGIWPLTEIEIPPVTFEEIGGQKEAVEKMREIGFALRYPESFQRWGSRLPKGVLLVGPPGNGKTLLGKAMAHEAGAYLVPVNISDILIKWVGSSERKVTALFNEAKRREGKTILFFDELDALGISRDRATHEYTVSLLLTINQNMDGIRENPNVMVIATTNKKENIDPALLREGRFDIIVEIPLIDRYGRTEVLAIHAAKAEKEAGSKIFEEINFDLLAEKTEGASGARLAEIIRRATWRRGVQEAKAKEDGRSVNLPLISTEEILRVIGSYEAR